MQPVDPRIAAQRPTGWCSARLLCCGTRSPLYLIRDAASRRGLSRVGYFITLNGPLNGHPPSYYTIEASVTYALTHIMHAHAHAGTRAHARVYAHTRTHTYLIGTHAHRRIHEHTCARTHACTDSRTDARKCTHRQTYLRLHIRTHSHTRNHTDTRTRHRRIQGVWGTCPLDRLKFGLCVELFCCWCTVLDDS